MRTLHCTLLASLVLLAGCGDPPQGSSGGAAAIRGGVPANDHPEVALLDLYKNGQLASYCSGTVIAPRVVLTAGHCVAGFDGWTAHAPYAEGQTATGHGVVYDYRNQGAYIDFTKHDVGIVLLDSPIRLRAYPWLATTESKNDTLARNLGRVQNGAVSTRDFYIGPQVHLFHGALYGVPNFYVTSEIIEGGDSGGPLVHAFSRRVLGVNSGAGGGWEVLARVDPLYDWIQQQIAAAGGYDDTPGMQAGAPWPTFGRTAARMSAARGQAPFAMAKEKWSFSTGGAVESSPAIAADGTIYVGSDDASLYAVHPDGTLKWRFVAGADVQSSPAIGTDGTVYVGSHDGKVYAIDPESGTAKWSFSTGALVRSSPAIGADGTIFVGGYDGLLYALDPAGAVKWTFAGGAIDSSPAVGPDGTVYVGTYANKLYAIDPATGAQKWAIDAADRFNGSPAVGPNGVVYAASWDGTVHAVATATGKEIWATKPGGPIDSTPTVTFDSFDGKLYIGSWDQKMYVLDAKLGLVQKTLTTSGLVRSTAAASANGAVIFGNGFAVWSLDGTYEGYDDVKWTMQTGGYVVSSPAIAADGTIYVGSGDGKLHAYGWW